MQRGYSEADLVKNRASVLIVNGTEEERRAWALEAANHFHEEGPLCEVKSLPELVSALAGSRGVVFAADVGKLGLEAQRLMLRCLTLQEERPKLVLGLSGPVEAAREKGILREDLLYRLRLARVDLDAEGLREVLRERRTQGEANAVKESLPGQPPEAARSEPEKTSSAPSVRRTASRAPAARKSARR